MEEINNPLFVDADNTLFKRLSPAMLQGNSNNPTEPMNESIAIPEVNEIKPKKERIRCPECNRYTAENQEQLTRHIRKQHRGENPYQCYMCEYSTYNSVVFDEHVRIHRGIKPFACSYCSHTSASKRNLQKHELIHRPDNPLKCHQCDYIARHQKGLGWHMRKFHVDQKDDEKICQFCNKRFSMSNRLEKHLAVIKKCEECEFISCSKYLVDVHGVKVHGWKKVEKERKANNFQCALCVWSSNSKLKIMLHLIHHPNQKVNEDFLDISILRKYGIMT